MVYWHQTFVSFCKNKSLCNIMSGTTYVAYYLNFKAVHLGKKQGVAWCMVHEMRWMCSNRKTLTYVCLKSEITSGSVEKAWNHNIIDICFFLFQTEAIATALNWALDSTDYKERQYLNQNNLKWLTIHYISAPFHMSVLTLTMEGFAEHTVHALCLQQPAEFHTFTNARDLLMSTVHFLRSIYVCKTQPCVTVLHYWYGAWITYHYWMLYSVWYCLSPRVLEMHCALNEISWLTQFQLVRSKMPFSTWSMKHFCQTFDYLIPHIVHKRFYPMRLKKNCIKHVIFCSEGYLQAKLYGYVVDVVGKRFPPRIKTMIACRSCHAISMPARVNAHISSRNILGRVHTYILITLVLTDFSCSLRVDCQLLHWDMVFPYWMMERVWVQYVCVGVYVCMREREMRKKTVVWKLRMA